VLKNYNSFKDEDTGSKKNASIGMSDENIAKTLDHEEPNEAY